MKHFQYGSFPTEPQSSFYTVASVIGGIIRNTSLLILMLWYGFAAAAAAVDTAKSIWHHPGVRSFVDALEADLADAASSTVDLNRQPRPPSKELEKVQRDENRARRKLAAELRQRKASAGKNKAVRHYGRLI
jgi:hypothetical protein